MDKRAQPPLYEELTAAFEWWREAGLDCDFSDEPANWLAARPAQPEPRRQPAAARQIEDRTAATAWPEIAVDRRSLPQDLGSFAQWWLSAPGLDGGRTSGRVAPRGRMGAQLMVLVPEPEREDREVLLSGPQGRLLDEMLRAMACDAGQVYFASALPRHLPGADWPALAGSGIGEVLRRHIALVAPRRLIAFGGNVLPLMGNGPPQGAAVLRQINLEGQTIPLLAARSLPALLERPGWKGDVWKAWLTWTSRSQAG